MQAIIGKLLVNLINPTLIFQVVKLFLGFIREAIKSSKTDWDDKNILPLWIVTGKQIYQ